MYKDKFKPPYIIRVQRLNSNEEIIPLYEIQLIDNYTNKVIDAIKDIDEYRGIGILLAKHNNMLLESFIDGKIVNTIVSSGQSYMKKLAGQ